MFLDIKAGLEEQALAVAHDYIKGDLLSVAKFLSFRAKEY